MSHYRAIKTSLTQGAALVRALTQLGVAPAVAPSLTENRLEVQNGWSTSWVAIRVTSDQLQGQGLIPRRLFGGGAIGWRWSDSAGAYELVSDTSSDSVKLADFVQRVQQRYGVEVSLAAAVEAGWSPYEEVQADGSVVITCTRY